MEQICSRRLPFLTLDYIQNESENKSFDRKSSKVQPVALAPVISAFANAEGGCIVIGVSDKKKTLEGIQNLNDEQINHLLNAPKDFCHPMPKHEFEWLDIINEQGKPDQLLLLHIEANPEQIVRTNNESTFLRIGDQSREMKGEDLRNLEYSKNARHYEDELNRDATISDLDEDLLKEYQRRIGAENQSFAQTLKARGFLKERNWQEWLTNAAVLLFAKNVGQFYPNCRVRFVRYEGNEAATGTRMNLVRDINFEFPILKIIQKAKDFISTQFREFTSLDFSTGLFETVPEYPEFAWLEGIVNAVAHREYSMEGAFILVAMFDDHLEITSPGRLPNIVTVENIQYTRFSRNPRIARVLTEFGWVRELNEGVPRIYQEMKNSFLDQPIYTEPNDSQVKLVFKNNIHIRRQRRASVVPGRFPEIWNKLDDLEKKILIFCSNHSNSTRTQLVEYTGYESKTVLRRINHLIQWNLLVRNGCQNDPKQSYSINYPEREEH